MGVADVLNIKTTFDLATSPCRFIFEDLSDYASLGISSADVLGNLVITGPTGPIHSNISWVTPDIDLAVSPIIDTILLPTDTNGKPFPGVYSVQYTAQVSGGVLPGEYSYTNTFEYTYETPELKIAPVNNPYNAYLSFTDVTEYTIASVTPLKTYVNTLILPPLYGFQNIVSNSFRIAVTTPYYLEGLYDIPVPNGTATGSADGPVSISGSATNIGGEITIPALDVTVNVAHTGTTDTAALSADFSNINNHTDIISESTPHDHDVTIPTTFSTAEAVGNQFADPGTYTTTGHTVSITLDLAHTGTQDLSHSHDYSFDITGSGATVSTPITASGLEGDVSVSGEVSMPVSGTTTTPNIIGILQSESSVSGVEGTCEISQSVTLPNYTVSVSGNVSGNTDNTTITVPTITPSLVVRYAVKVA